MTEIEKLEDLTQLYLSYVRMEHQSEEDRLREEIENLPDGVILQIVPKKGGRK